MKTFLQLLSVRDMSCRSLKIHCSGTHLRFANVFSQPSQLFRFKLPLTSNFGDIYDSPTAVTGWRKSSPYRYFSVKVKEEDEVRPGEPVKSYIIPTPSSLGDHHVTGKQFTLASSNLIRQKNNEAVLNLIEELSSIKSTQVRDKQLINSICSQLYSMELNCTIKDYVKLLYCLSRLYIPHEQLILKVLKNISALLNEIYKPSPLMTGISRSMACLLVRDTEILHNIINWYNKRINVVDLSAASETICSLAILHYFPAEADILLKQMKSSNIIEHSSSLKYLNFVWALSLLDRAEENMVESVLALGFRKKLESIVSSEARRSLYLKLNNINAYAVMRKLDIKIDASLLSYEKPWLSHLKERRKKDPVIKSFLDGLTNLLPHRTFNAFIESNSGCIIDALCIFDNDHNPMTELDFVKKKSGIKIAMIILGFKDLCFPKKNFVNGIIEFHKRILEEDGFKVLFILYNEFPTQENIRVKSDYLEKKIRSVLPNFST